MLMDGEYDKTKHSLPWARHHEVSELYYTEHRRWADRTSARHTQSFGKVVQSDSCLH
jgi:hypothetical protein